MIRLNHVSKIYGDGSKKSRRRSFLGYRRWKDHRIYRPKRSRENDNIKNDHRHPGTVRGND